MYIVLAKQVYLWLVNKGLGVHFNSHNPGNCRIVPGLKCGSEKISVSASGLAFITNGQNSLTNCNETFTRGSIYLFDFNFPGKNPKVLIIRNLPSKDFIDTFNPRGIDVYEGIEKRKIRLYVINLGNNKNSIEVFEFYLNQPSELYHVETLQDKNFVCLNDLTIISEDEFYVTNSIKYCHSSIKYLAHFEMIFGFNTANILYYKQGYSAVVAYGSSFQGITLSTDNRYLYCVSSASSAVNVYNRTIGGAVKLLRQIKVGFMPDKIHIDPTTGDLYVGLIKETFGMFMLASNLTEYSSASALKLELPPNKDPRGIKIREIFHNNGKGFLGVVTSAVHYQGKYLFGTLFDKLAYCETTRRF